jgi:4-hydroxy-tetrahydrodipicolinate reductase
MTPLRFVQVGLGPIGREIARLAITRRWLAIVGAVDPKPGLAGHDVGSLLGASPLGVPVEPDLERALERCEPDLVLHGTGSFLPDVSDQLEAVLRHGASVVSTCEELAYPFHRHPERSRALDALAVANGAVLLGTGVNPGFVMDKLVATMAGACRSVERIEVRRVVDASTRREPLQRKVGAGLTPKEFDDIARSGRLGHIGLVESAQMISDVLGLPSSRKVLESIRPRVAQQAVVTEFLTVEAGEVAGIEHDVTVEADGRERVRLELRMFVGAPDPHDAIEITGSPPISLRITGGVHGDAATAAIVVNAARTVKELAPGLRTMLDLPLRFARADE